jgi:hypothetical protein
MDLHDYTKIRSGLNKVISKRNLQGISTLYRGSHVYLARKGRSAYITTYEIDDSLYDFADDATSPMITIQPNVDMTEEDMERLYKRYQYRRSLLMLQAWVRVSYSKGILTLSKDIFPDDVPAENTSDMWS